MQNNEKPLVSVVIPCYNHEKFVQDCIQSVIDQTYENIELIIIDDGSKDSSVDKIKGMIPLCEERFSRFEFRYRPNKGLSSTLNEGLEWCNGKYFSAIASDDQMIEEKTEIQVDYLEKNDKCAGVFGNVTYIDEDNRAIYNSNLNFKKNTFEDVILFNYIIMAPTQLCRLDLIRKVGQYNVDIKIEDYFMWLKLTENGLYSLDSLNNYFTKYRTHSSNTSGQSELMYSERLKVLKYFSYHPLYLKAISNSYLITAHDYINSDKIKALGFYFKAIKENPYLFIEYKNFQFLVRYIYRIIKFK